MRKLVGAFALLLVSCGPGDRQSDLAGNNSSGGNVTTGSVETVEATPDLLQGMWHWGTDNYACSTNIQCRYNGTFLVSSTTTANRYDVKLNITQVMYPGSVIEQQSEAEQNCVGLRTRLRIALQCSVDRARYPNWTPVDFSFETDPTGQNLTGIMLDDPSVPINGSKL